VIEEPPIIPGMGNQPLTILGMGNQPITTLGMVTQLITTLDGGKLPKTITRTLSADTGITA
jgi:hypothetical protein